MNTPEQQPNLSTLETLETELALTKAEMEEFKKLPKEEQEKQKDEKLASLKILQDKLNQVVQEAIKTGKLEEAKTLLEQQQTAIADLESLLRADPEARQAEFQSFLRETYKLWGMNQEMINQTKISVEIKSPKDEDYTARKADIDPEKFGEFTLNPDTQDLNWETLQDKIFIPDLSSLEGRTVQKVAEYLITNFSDKYYLPGLEYYKFIIKNPNKVPAQLKDGNSYFNFGSLVRSRQGYWLVPYASWRGSEGQSGASWLGNFWRSDARAVLLEI